MARDRTRRAGLTARRLFPALLALCACTGGQVSTGMARSATAGLAQLATVAQLARDGALETPATFPLAEPHYGRAVVWFTGAKPPPLRDGGSIEFLRDRLGLRVAVEECLSAIARLAAAHRQAGLAAGSAELEDAMVTCTVAEEQTRDALAGTVPTLSG